jgi:hypothetical protein
MIGAFNAFNAFSTANTATAIRRNTNARKAHLRLRLQD